VIVRRDAVDDYSGYRARDVTRPGEDRNGRHVPVAAHVAERTERFSVEQRTAQVATSIL
jgi:hypothetical protein